MRTLNSLVLAVAVGGFVIGGLITSGGSAKAAPLVNGIEFLPDEDAFLILGGDGFCQTCTATSNCPDGSDPPEGCGPQCQPTGQSACSGSTRSVCTWDLALACWSGSTGCGTQEAHVSCENVGCGLNCMRCESTLVIGGPCQKTDC